MEELLLGLPPFINGTFSSKCDLQLTKNIYGISAPVIVTLTLLNNILYVFVINYDKADRTASTVQNTGIATSNTLHGVFQLPVFIYFFNRISAGESISPHWCNAYRIIGYILPNIFHTASVWQLVLYGIQRFLCFRWPFSAFVWYKIEPFMKYTIVIYICALLVHVYKLFDFTYESGDFCELVYRNGIDIAAYSSYYFWFCTLAIHLIPCVVMTICTCLLVYAIRLTYLRRKRIFATSRTGVSRNRKSTMQECQAIGTLVLTLSIEWPIAILVLRHSVYKIGYTDCTGLIIAHFVLLVTYSLFLPLYVVLNHEFRNTVMQIVSDIKKWFRRHDIVRTNNPDTAV